MRLWSISPSLLDRMGLLGLWREALLAQRILQGGPPYKVPYGNHPQLERFKSHPNPTNAISKYLYQVFWAGKGRGYNFNEKLMGEYVMHTSAISIPRGQINYEIRLLISKLEKRDPQKRTEVINTLLGNVDPVDEPPYWSSWVEIHSLFAVDDQDLNIASWERPVEGI